MKRILVVDNDKDFRSSIFEAFKGSDYDVVTAENSLWAMTFLKTLEIDLVISDLRILPMSGYDLLTQIKEEYPHVIRIIMSHSTEEANVLRAILQNIAKFYILKPLKKEKLLEYVDQIFETEEILKSNDLLHLINNAEKLPTIEASYQNILSMIEREADTGVISKEIEKDFAISSKLLQIANSAYYGLKTGSVKHATVYLGLHNLKSLVYSTSILDSLNSASEEDERKIKDLWTHALLTSKLLHYIYENFLEKKLPESAYSAGLLHNIGSLILIQNHFADYTGVINSATPKSLNMLDLERETFGATHQEAGGYLISRWKLPFPIVEAALYHHRPLDPNVINKELVASVHIAQHYAWILTKHPVVTEFYPQAFDVLGIPKDNFEAAVNWKSWINS